MASRKDPNAVKPYWDGNVRVFPPRQAPRRREFNKELMCGADCKCDGKPCTNWKGYKTLHVGTGRCYMHGGGSVKHGKKPGRPKQTVQPVGGVYHGTQYKRLDEALDTVAKLVIDPLDLTPEVTLAKAIIRDFLDTYAEYREALMLYRMRFHKAVRASVNAKSLKQFKQAREALQAALDDRPRGREVRIEKVADLLETATKVAAKMDEIKKRQSLTPEKIVEYRDMLVMIVMKHCTVDQAKAISADLEKI